VDRCRLRDTHKNDKEIIRIRHERDDIAVDQKGDMVVRGKQFGVPPNETIDGYEPMIESDLPLVSQSYRAVHGCELIFSRS